MARNQSSAGRDIAYRGFVFFFGFVWLAFSLLAGDPMPRELTGVAQWFLLPQSISSLILIVMALLPRSILCRASSRLIFFFAVAVVEAWVVVVIFRSVLRTYALYSSLTAGTELFPERGPRTMIEFAGMGLAVAVFGVVLCLASIKISCRHRKRATHREGADGYFKTNKRVCL